MDLADDAEPVYGAPPLLTEKLKSGELDAVLNYWHFGARLEAQGYRRLVGIGEVQEALGVPASVPQLGYVFQEGWADASTDLVQAFARASREAKEIMQTSDAEWQRLMPVTRGRERGRARRPSCAATARASSSIGGPSSRPRRPSSIAVLAELGGEKLVGPGQELAPGTFWPKVSF